MVDFQINLQWPSVAHWAAPPGIVRSKNPKETVMKENYYGNTKVQRNHDLIIKNALLESEAEKGGVPLNAEKNSQQHLYS